MLTDIFYQNRTKERWKERREGQKEKRGRDKWKRWNIIFLEFYL